MPKLQLILDTMYNSKKTAVGFAFALMSLTSFAQTIGDIAAHQRAKAQAELRGEVLPITQSPTALASSNPDIRNVPKPVPIKPLQVLATYEIDGVSKALINNQGNSTSVGVGDKINQYKIESITSDRVGFQTACKKTAKSKAKAAPRCKVIGINVGGSL